MILPRGSCWECAELGSCQRGPEAHASHSAEQHMLNACAVTHPTALERAPPIIQWSRWLLQTSVPIPVPAAGGGVTGTGRMWRASQTGPNLLFLLSKNEVTDHRSCMDPRDRASLCPAFSKRK